MMQRAYSLLGLALSPLVARWLKRRAARGKEDPARLGERFGHPSAPRPSGELLWLHAASVGETQSVLTLLRRLQNDRPAAHFLVTTGTVTSAALMAQQSLPRTIHQFVPVDLPRPVTRFLAHWQPDMVLWVESELWPGLLWHTRARRVPMLLLNARMSAGSYAGWKRWPRIIRSLLACFTAIYAGSHEDAERFRSLGAQDVREVGNLKYDAENLQANEALIAELAPHLANRPCWVAASTHANEEQMVAEVAQEVAQQFPGLLTVLVPRHATRGEAIATDLRARGVTLAQRSKHEPITPVTEVYLADTMGELGSFYRLSEIAFLGGSLVAVGGHNPLEPARLSTALITGPYIHNFTAIMQHLAQHEALLIVENKEGLRRALVDLLRSTTQRATMREQALALVTRARGASESILQHVAELLRTRAA